MIADYLKVIEPAWSEVDLSDDLEFLVTFSRVRTEVGNLLAAHLCQAEVCNGGFYQFFTNSTGLLAPEALVAFQAMGLTEWAGLLEQAMAYFPAPYPRVNEDRQDYLRANKNTRKSGVPREDWDPFWKLDEKFDHWLCTEPEGVGSCSQSVCSRHIAINKRREVRCYWRLVRRCSPPRRGDGM